MRELRRLLGGAGRRHRRAEADGLRRAERVEQDRLGHVPQQALLVVVAPHHARRRDRPRRSTGRSGRGWRRGARASARRTPGRRSRCSWPGGARPSSNSSATSKWRLASDTTVPPPVIAMSAENWPVPCISGQATTITGGARLRRRPARRPRRRRSPAAVPSERVAAGAEHVEQVVLAPHHALRHAGGAAGVEQQQVVAAAAPAVGCERRARRRRRPRTASPSPGPAPASSATTYQRLTAGQPVADARRAGRRTWRGTRPPRRRRCRTGRRSRPGRSGSWC